MTRNLPRIVSILGPTGAGKTSVSLALCERFGGEVVNFDSRQVYRGLEVVTAQPTPAEQKCCPHHLYGFLSPCEAITAGVFTRMAREKIDEITGRGGLPVLVGGTGLYLESLVWGLDEIPKIDPAVRERIMREYDERGPTAMHARLVKADPQYAARIHPNDRQRVIRALEVFEGTGRPFSGFHSGRRSREPGIDALVIGITMDLSLLTPRLAGRVGW